jgi:hypothetical protein
MGYAPAVAAARSARPVMLKAKWQRQVLGNLTAAVPVFAADDRYLAVLVAFPDLSTRLTLLDEQTNRQTTLAPPPCTGTDSMSNFFGGGLHFGGPWLMVGCDLYNLNTRHWIPFRLSPLCVGGCDAVGIGRYWVKIKSDGGQAMYPQYSFYLQNIASGRFVEDPAIPGGRTFDDLNAPSGSSALCSPLRYPVDAGDPRESPILGGLRLFGPGPNQFAFISSAVPEISTWRLRRCHSKLDLDITDNSLVGNDDRYDQSGPVVSSAAVAFQSDSGLVFEGWALPSLRRFTIQWRGVRGCGGPPSVAALTERHIYVWGECGRIYSTKLPTARELVHGRTGAAKA